MRRRAPILFAFAAFALEGIAGGQSYGTGAQIVTIGAAAFRSIQDHRTYIRADGYFYDDDHGTFAALDLPEGAVVERLCLYAFGTGTSAKLSAVKLVPGGELPDFAAISGDVVSTSNLGYGRFCSPPLSISLRSRIDVDGDDQLDNVAYYVRALSPAGGFGGVQIEWRRPVSAPPLAPTFGDVPLSDPAFAYIEALAASGITVGCGDGTIYCPDGSLTRRQMAVFLAKALGLHWTD